jgi:hypothetical protein
MSDSTLRNTVLDTARDASVDFVYYDRKGDEELTHEQLKRALAEGTVTIAEIASAFGEGLSKELSLPMPSRIPRVDWFPVDSADMTRLLPILGKFVWVMEVRHVEGVALGYFNGIHWVVPGLDDSTVTHWADLVRPDPPPKVESDD